MKRYVKQIVIHSTATFDPKTTQHYGCFHYVVERNGEIKKIHPESAIIKHLPDTDNEAIHIAYAGGRNKSVALGDTRTLLQEKQRRMMPGSSLSGSDDMPSTFDESPAFRLHGEQQESRSSLVGGRVASA